MSLSVKHLNADTSFYLTFSPAYALDQPKESIPGSFTILIDPWLSGPSTVWHSLFALTHHVIPACVKSLAELPQPDLVLISQDKPDHCHKQTLMELEPDTDTAILGTPSATKKIKSWKYFDPACVMSLQAYDPKKESTVTRIPIPAFSPSGSPGEVTISLMTPRFDLTGVHNAIGITYRSPSSVLSARAGSFRNLPSLPPTTTVSTSQGSRPSTPTPNSTTVQPSPLGHVREKTISVIYSPHGVDYDVIRPFACNHLLNNSALPLTALMHSFDRCFNPWWMGGTICAGMPGGMTIARNLYARAWISAHDEDKLKSGISVKSMKIEKHNVGDIKEKLHSFDSAMDGMEEKALIKTKVHNNTELVSLDAGQGFVIPAK